MLDRPLDLEALHPDPVEQFRLWFSEAQQSGEPEPEAMALATSTSDGVPAVRFVLLKGVDRGGFVFYTNLRSRKGLELDANPRAAAAFRWWLLQRQVRLSGPVTPVTDSDSDAYFASRPRGAQIGAWASAQSESLSSRQELDRKVGEVSARFGPAEVPRPPWWGGFRIQPIEMEFWQGRPDRLHDRALYVAEGDSWVITRLSP
jgi:pyridoxamine 5'-phosphate oxidase